MRIAGGAWRGRRLVAPAGGFTRPTADKVRAAIFDVLQALPQMPHGDTRQGPPGTLVAEAHEAASASPTAEGTSASSVTAGTSAFSAAERTSASAAAAEASAAGMRGGPLAGHRVLDLYAGSGALGIEALSRGAAACTFVEHDRSALVALRRNLAALGVDVAPGGRPDAGPKARVAAVPVARSLQADARSGCMYTLVLADPPYARSADAQDMLTRLLGPVLAPQAVIVVETSVKEDVVLPWRLVRVKTYGATKVTFMDAVRP